MSSSSASSQGFALLAIAAFFYFAPTLLALARNVERRGGIIVLNVFLGWTLLGWVAALVWAVSERRGQPAPVHGSAGKDIRRLAAEAGARNRAMAEGGAERAARLARDHLAAADEGSSTREMTPEQEEKARGMALRAYEAAIVGLPYPNADGSDRGALLAALPVGTVLRLDREPENPHDSGAVAVQHGGRTLGYVARRAGWIGAALDEGDLIAGVLKTVDEENGVAVAATMLVLILRDG